MDEKEALAAKVINRTHIRKDRRRHLMIMGYMVDAYGVRHHVSRSIPFSVWLWDLYHPENLLTPGFNVHHEDANKLHDIIENLRKLTSKQHAIRHMRGNSYSRGKILTQQHKDKIRNKNLNKTLTQQHKDRIAEGKKRNYELKRRFAETHARPQIDGQERKQDLD